MQDDYIDLPGVRSALTGAGDMLEVSKIAHDIYRVFVNKDYVGNKVLLTQTDNIEDLEKYLKNKGFENFSTQLTGNEYVINTIKDDFHDMKNTLQIYLHTR